MKAFSSGSSAMHSNNKHNIFI